MRGPSSRWGRLGVWACLVALQSACGETTDGKSEGAGGTSGTGGAGGIGGTSSTAGTGAGGTGAGGTGAGGTGAGGTSMIGAGAAGSAGAPNDGVPSGCEMLLEKNPSPRCVDEERCEQARMEDVPRTFDLSLDEAGTDESGDDVPHTEQEMSERVDCLERWLEQLGLEPIVHSRSNNVEVTAKFGEVEAVLDSAVLASYSVYCAEYYCDHCFDHDEQACAADAFCREYLGKPLNEPLDCLGERAFAGCIGHDQGCSQAPSYARDAAGQCWWFPTLCYDTPHLPDDPSCGDAEAYPADCL